MRPFVRRLAAAAMLMCVAAATTGSARPHIPFAAAAAAAAPHALLAQRDASTVESGGKNNEGENHGPVSVPAGSVLTSLPVGTAGDKAAVFWSTRSNNQLAEQAFVMIHGRTRNGNQYWQTMENALVAAVNASYPGASSNSIVAAPQYYSTVFNSGEYTSNELAWGDVNAWQAGEIATHPPGTTSSAFDVLDAFVAEFSNKTRYPALRNVTLVGHGGGGQLMQRYAVVGNDPPSDVYVRYIYGDPSSSVYFTKDRPKVDPAIANISSCPWFDYWRYGFTNFTDIKPTGGKQPIEYFAQYAQRDVVSMVGFQDVDASGDQYCMAKLQGGNKRRDRNLAYWKYINKLAGTTFDLTGFNATYTNLPDWSNVTHGKLAHRLIVIEQADHDPNLVFGSDEGRAALFSSGTLPTGWRPPGWNPNGTAPPIPSSGHANATNSAAAAHRSPVPAADSTAAATASDAVPTGGRVALAVAILAALAASTALLV